MKNRHVFYVLGLTFTLLFLFTNCKGGFFYSSELASSVSSSEDGSSTTTTTATSTEQQQTQEGSVSGQCGQDAYTCLNGTTLSNSREEDGFYKWSCLGLDGGEDIHTCRQAIVPLSSDPVDGQCDNSLRYACFNGTIPDHTREEGTFYKWSCLGLHGGTDIHTCNKEIPASSQPVNGQCDDSKHYACLNDTTVSSKRIEDGFYKWTCLGLHGGTDAFCQSVVPPQAVNGQCGQEEHYTCLNGTTPSNTIESDGFYRWSCLGLHGGSDIHTCNQAMPPQTVNGACGQEEHYTCLNKTTPDDLMEEDGFYKWTCLGLHGGDDISCSKEVPPSVPVESSDSFEVTQTALTQKVDILMVVDDSGSMSQYQNMLGQRFGDLVSNIIGVDWQLAFINTNSSASSTIHEVLSPKTSNVQNRFLTLITNPPGAPSDSEYPLTNITRVIANGQNSQNFFRNDANLVVVILTNEGSDTKTAQNVLDTLKTQLGNDKRLFAYAIIPTGNTSNRYLYRIRDLVSRTGGITGDIDSTNYTSILQNMSKSLEAKLTLKEIPLRYEGVIQQTISLNFIPSANRVTDYVYNPQTNKIVFKTTPPGGTTIQVQYKYVQ